MNTFALDKNYQPFNFEEISVEELQFISGGSGGGCSDLVYGSAILGGIAGFGAGSSYGLSGSVIMGGIGFIGGALTGNGMC